MTGCRYALHVASPYVLAEPRDTATVIGPAVQGTRRALAAARKAGVERVVVTSSVVAMNGHMIGGTFGHDNAATVRDLEWTPIPFEKTILDTAASLQAVVEA